MLSRDILEDPIYRQTPFLEATMGLNQSANPSHFGTVRTFRKKFKSYSKEDFRNLSKKPLVKEMLVALEKVPAEDVAERVKAHLED